MHGARDMDDKYTIHPMNFALTYGQAWFKAGDLIDIITGATIVGPYCVWPKTEPRMFVVVNDGWPEEKVFINRKVLFKECKGEIKFYQKLNRKKG